MIGFLNLFRILYLALSDFTVGISRDTAGFSTLEEVVYVKSLAII